MSGHKYQGGEQPVPGSSGLMAGPLVPYDSSSEEASPLLPGRIQRAMSKDTFKFLMYYSGLALLALLFITVNLYLHFTNCPLYPSAMNAVRRAWEKEAIEHEIVREEWQLEQQRHVIAEEKWKLQVEWHEKDVVRRIREENERQERVRNQWVQETDRHACEAEEYEKAVERRVREEERRQQNVREEWAQEMKEHKRELEEMERREDEHRENEREKWRREVEEHDKTVEEHKKREEEERQKLNMFWGNIEAHTCITYGTREYTAKLMNLPTTWEHRVEACKATAVEIHGRSYLPKSCEDKGPGVVIGRWEVNQHEPDCASSWIWYKDKGCTAPGSGKRLIENYLENLPQGGDWREFCATTPAYFHGMVFEGAQQCLVSPANGGTWGYWEIDDTGCLKNALLDIGNL